MKILVLQNKIPAPLSHAGINKGIANYLNIIKESHDVDFLCPQYENEDEREIAAFEKTFLKITRVRVKSEYPVPVNSFKDRMSYYIATYIKRMPGLVYFYKFREVEEKLSELLSRNKYDLIQVYSLYMCSYIDTILRYNKNLVLGPIDDEVEASRLMSETKGIKQKIVSYLNYRINREYYRGIFSKCAHILFFSNKDIETTNKQYRLQNKTGIINIPFEFNEEKEAPSSNPYPAGTKTILFVGALSPFFNQDAVKFFADQIFPLVLKEIPECVFYVAGHSPGKEILELGKRESIVVTGRLSDQELADYISNADVYVSPLRYGTGIKTKIIEALKYGKAIVSTSHSLNALRGFSPENIRIADETESFAQEVIAVIRNSELRKKLEINSRKLFESEYSYSALKGELLKTIDSLA